METVVNVVRVAERISDLKAHVDSQRTYYANLHDRAKVVERELFLPDWNPESCAGCPVRRWLVHKRLEASIAASGGPIASVLREYSNWIPHHMREYEK